MAWYHTLLQLVYSIQVAERSCCFLFALFLAPRSSHFVRALHSLNALLPLHIFDIFTLFDIFGLFTTSSPLHNSCASFCTMTSSNEGDEYTPPNNKPPASTTSTPSANTRSKTHADDSTSSSEPSSPATSSNKSASSSNSSQAADKLLADLQRSQAQFQKELANLADYRQKMDADHAAYIKEHRDLDKLLDALHEHQRKDKAADLRELEQKQARQRQEKRPSSPAPPANRPKSDVNSFLEELEVSSSLLPLILILQVGHVRCVRVPLSLRLNHTLRMVMLSAECRLLTVSAVRVSS